MISQEEPALKRHVKDRIGLDTHAAGQLDTQHDLIKNKENKLLKGSAVVTGADGSITKTVYNAATTGGSTSSAGDVSKSDEISGDQRKQEPGSQMLSSNFDSMTLKQENRKYHENLAATKALNNENQKVDINFFLLKFSKLFEIFFKI